MQGKHSLQGANQESCTTNTPALRLPSLSPCSWLAAFALRSPRWTRHSICGINPLRKKVIGIQNIFASDFDFIFHKHLSTKKRKNELYKPIH